MVLALVWVQGQALAARVTSVYGGARACIARMSDGTVWQWGYNVWGQLGDGTTTERHTPVQVHGPNDIGYLGSITAIMGGEPFNFALKSDGTVWAWGWNNFGSLGDGTNTDSHTPVQVSGLTSVTALGGRGYHALALKSDRTVWAWGLNASGQLGDGTTTNRNSPVPVIGLGGVVAVTGGYNFSLATKADHTLWSWGANGNGELGNGTNAASYSPVRVSGLSNVVQASSGWKHAVAVTSDGTVWTWGLNATGQIGDGTTTNSNMPFHVGGLSNVIAVSGGDCHTAALKSDGTVWTWGCNDRAQLGDGTNVDRYTPVQVSTATGLTDVIAIAARDYHNIAIKSDGTVWTWGWNINGQLGNGTTIDSNVPVRVLGLTPSAGTLASAPTIGTATAGNGNISVTFTPDAIGTGTLVNYTVDCGGVTNMGGSSPITVTDLTNGTSYTCRVMTTTTVGDSAWSAPSNAVTPGTPGGFALEAVLMLLLEE